MHDVLYTDISLDFRALDNSRNKHLQEEEQKNQQQVQAAKIRKQKAETNKEKQQDINEDGEGKDRVTKTNDKGKQINNYNPESTQKRKNNPS